MTKMEIVEEASVSYPGWRIVAACFVMAIFAWGLGFYGHSVYLAEIVRGRGWSASFVSGATTLYYLVSSVLVIFVSDFIRRFGPSPVVIVGSVLLATATALVGSVAEPWQLIGAYLLMSVGWATLSLAAITYILSLWFSKRRGLAISLALNGASVGGIITAPVLIMLSNAYGFQQAMLIVAMVTLAILLPLMMLCMRTPPQAVAAGLAGDGMPAAARSKVAGTTRFQYLATLHFWTVAAPFAFGLTAQAGFIVHQVAFLEPNLGRTGAGYAVAITTVMAVLGRLGLGLSIDRFNQRSVTALSLTSQALALIWMLQTTDATSLICACALFGFSVGNLITLPPLIIQREYPAEAFGMLTALVVAISQFAYSFGPGILGWLRDFAHDYSAAIAFCIASQLIAALLVKWPDWRPIARS